uniref:J domain-containing protein n=1 Tax=Caenorhabditis japonica TaxID=281687 RepID=A0A8R1IB52_CAEJA
MAYEILGSEDKRKAYDMTRIRTSPMPTSSSHPMSNRYRSRSSQKQYTDVDIDYKDFEHFQRSTRRRPQYHSHFEMPNEFYAEFGGFKKRVFKSEYEQAQAEVSLAQNLALGRFESFSAFCRRAVCTQSF